MGYIAVDFDGTLAKWDGWNKELGEPVPLMLERLKTWLKEGKEVRIFTARAEIPEEVPPIEAWCEKHLGQKLRVTNVKDLSMIELWDDRAIGVEMNTGRI